VDICDFFKTCSEIEAVVTGSASGSREGEKKGEKNNLERLLVDRLVEWVPKIDEELKEEEDSTLLIFTMIIVDEE
jgi:hypothetical protein